MPLGIPGIPGLDGEDGHPGRPGYPGQKGEPGRPAESFIDKDGKVQTIKVERGLPGIQGPVRAIEGAKGACIYIHVKLDNFGYMELFI